MSIKEINAKRVKAGFNCKQCGSCCKGVEFINVYYEDKKRWERQGRTDLVNSKMITEWDNFGSTGLFKNKSSKKCPFISVKSGKCTCKIHNTKPSVCKYFPLDKKNAKELKCPGYAS